MMKLLKRNRIIRLDNDRKYKIRKERTASKRTTIDTEWSIRRNNKRDVGKPLPGNQGLLTNLIKDLTQIVL